MLGEGDVVTPSDDDRLDGPFGLLVSRIVIPDLLPRSLGGLAIARLLVRAREPAHHVDPRRRSDARGDLLERVRAQIDAALRVRATRSSALHRSTEIGSRTAASKEALAAPAASPSRSRSSAISAQCAAR